MQDNLSQSAAAQDLSRQLRHLVLTEPFARLNSEKAHWLSEAQAATLDLRYLALALLDQIMERSTVEAGCTLDEAVRHGGELLLLMDPSLEADAADAIARKVLDLLLNAREQHREFNVRYYDPARREWLARGFRLLRISTDEAGATRLKPGDAALTLQLAMLDISPEFLAEAESLMIRKAIERGRFTDAQTIAARARLRSMDYQTRLREQLFRIRRAPEAFSWREEVLPQLISAREHLEERQKHDQTMMDAVREHLPLTREPGPRAALIQLKTVLEDAAGRHNRLLSDVMQANEHFRGIQQSAFRARRRAPVPDPEAQLLEPLLNMPLAQLAGFSSLIWASCACAQLPRLMHLRGLFEACLVPVPQAPDHVQPELEQLPPPAPERFEAALIAQTETWLRAQVATHPGWRVSQTLEQAGQEDWNEAQRRCVLQIILRSYSRQDDPLGITVDPAGTFIHPLAAGDDLECRRDEARWQS